MRELGAIELGIGVRELGDDGMHRQAVGLLPGICLYWELHVATSSRKEELGLPISPMKLGKGRT